MGFLMIIDCSLRSNYQYFRYIHDKNKLGGYCDGVWEDIVMGYGRILCWGMGGYCDGVWEDIVMGYGRIL
jgi:hypothetical protein